MAATDQASSVSSLLSTALQALKELNKIDLKGLSSPVVQMNSPEQKCELQIDQVQ